MTVLYEDDPRIAAVQEAGIENILYKPFEDHELISAINRACQRLLRNVDELTSPSRRTEQP